MWPEAQSANQEAANSALQVQLVQGIAAGLSVVGTLAGYAAGWLKDRDLTVKRARQLDEATKRLAFWEAWLRVVGSLDFEQDGALLKEQAKSEILSASDSVLRLSWYEEAFLARPWPRWRTWLLLYIPSKGKSAIAFLPRFLFYSFGIGTVIDIATAVRFLSTRPALPIQSYERYLITSIAIILVQLLVAFFSRLWAIHEENDPYLSPRRSAGAPS